MITQLRMPLPNVNMPCPLLIWLVIVLFHCRASSPAQYALANPLVPPPTHAVTSPGLPHLHHLGAACQKVQDPVAQGGVETQSLELNDETGGY
jgi:hypothetical protein